MMSRKQQLLAVLFTSLWCFAMMLLVNHVASAQVRVSVPVVVPVHPMPAKADKGSKDLEKRIEALEARIAALEKQMREQDKK